MNDQQLKTLHEIYYQEIFGESPYDIGNIQHTWISELGINQRITKTFIKTCSMLETVQILNSKFDIYQNTEDNIVQEDYFVEGEYTAIRFKYEKVNGGIRFIYIEKASFVDIIASNIVVEYYLNRYSFIMSDVSHSPLGRKHWHNIIKLAFENKMKVTVVDSKFNEYGIITNISDIDQYYTIPGHANLRFKIQKQFNASLA